MRHPRKKKKPNTNLESLKPGRVSPRLVSTPAKGMQAVRL